MRRRWRWAVVLGVVAILAAIPAVVAAFPVADPHIATATLIGRIRASIAQPVQGLYESRGGLALPDVGRYGDLVAPFAETTRVQVWYRDQQHWRADTQTLGGEVDWYREPAGVWRWDSEDRRVSYSARTDEEPLRFPRAMDLSPPELGRRVLHEAAAGEITSIGARRVAGRAAAGLRITPASATTTIETIDVWADPATGVALRVDIHSGGANPILETQFLDVELDAPAASVVTFDPGPSGARVRQTQTLDVVEQLGRAAALIAPATAAVDLPRRGGPTGATFGSDFAIVVVAITPDSGLSRSLNALEPSTRPWGGEAALVETPLINAEFARINGLNYVLAGTVTVAELDRIAGLIDAGSA